MHRGRRPHHVSLPVYVMADQVPDQIVELALLDHRRVTHTDLPVRGGVVDGDEVVEIVHVVDVQAGAHVQTEGLERETDHEEQHGRPPRQRLPSHPRQPLILPRRVRHPSHRRKIPHRPAPVQGLQQLAQLRPPPKVFLLLLVGLRGALQRRYFKQLAALRAPLFLALAPFYAVFHLLAHLLHLTPRQLILGGLEPGGDVIGFVTDGVGLGSKEDKTSLFVFLR
mmetsp:Transcript_97648/g.260635  ORF Transcript_97648/g.260635 Transcript_97648/m.260635 type:complete len:224 (-) Transcript_97648:71-742(-)